MQTVVRKSHQLRCLASPCRKSNKASHSRKHNGNLSNITSEFIRFMHPILTDMSKHVKTALAYKRARKIYYLFHLFGSLLVCFFALLW